MLHLFDNIHVDIPDYKAQSLDQIHQAPMMKNEVIKKLLTQQR